MLNLLDADDIDQAASSAFRLQSTLINMARHARHSADMHFAHGEIAEAERWADLAERWEARADAHLHSHADR